MDNVLRALVYDDAVSLTLADVTQMAHEGKCLHQLSLDTARLFGKTLAAMTFMSACLKNEKGEISLAVKSDGTAGDIAVSCNHALRLRGYIYPAQATGSENQLLGSGALTIIRDDGYNLPFVGSCALKEGNIDASFEEYFRISEQLPTRICTLVETNEGGMVEFAAVIALQPLPFADEETLQKVADLDLKSLLTCAKDKGVFDCTREHFKEEFATWEEREAVYKCNCSRRYLTRVLVSLGEESMRRIIQEDGAVRVHCHYCNTDYEFTDEDADQLFT
jgi:molecular chaperone Hsp33